MAENVVSVRVRVDDDTDQGMRSVRQSAEQGGKKAGKEFADQFTRDANGRLRDSRGRFAAAGKEAGEAVADGAEEGADRGGGKGGIFGRLLESGKGAALGLAAGAGMAIGLALVGGVQKALQAGDMEAQLKASMMNTDDARLAGKAAASVYAQGFGESKAEVQKAARFAIQGLGAGAKDIEYVTRAATNLATVFEVDVRESINAARSLLTSGLAKDGKQAMDIVTGAMQMGDLGDDMIDTINEYSVQFKALGLTAPAALGMIAQMMTAGARNTDVAADALKEFAINAKDPKLAGAYKKLGLDSKEMLHTMASGGKGAAKGLGEIVAALKEVEDPVKRNALAVELFGTKSEDLQAALMAIDPKSAVEAFGDVGGAAGRMGDTLEDTDANKLRKFQRSAEKGFTRFGASVIDAFNKVMKNKDVKKFGEFWAEEIQPGLEDFWQFTKDELGPVLSDILAGALEDVTSALGDLADAYKDNETELKSLYRWLKRAGDLAENDTAKGFGKFLVMGFTLATRAMAATIRVAGLFVNGFRTARNALRPVIESITDKIETILKKTRRVRAVLATILAGMFHPLYAAVDGPVRWAVGKIGQLVSLINRVTGMADGIKKVGRTVGKALATGGIVGAATGGAHGGLRWVGEQGPELVELPYGSTVMSNPDSMQALSTSGGQQTVTIEINSSGSRTDALLLDILRSAIRVRGGNAQTVLGT